MTKTFQQVSTPVTSKGMIPFPIAQLIAEKLCDIFYPFCSREPFIVGSVRRGERHTGDIELLLAPSPWPGMFGPTWEHTPLDSFVDTFVKDHGIRNGNAIVMNGPKAKTFLVDPGSFGVYDYESPIKLELYLQTPPADWGVLSMIRTGPMEFSKWIVTPRSKGGPLPSNFRVEDARILMDNGDGLSVALIPNEDAYFKLLGIDYLQPHDRRPDWKHERYRYTDSTVIVEPLIEKP